jgi:hypothetical protein
MGSEQQDPYRMMAQPVGISWCACAPLLLGELEPVHACKSVSYWRLECCRLPHAHHRLPGTVDPQASLESLEDIFTAARHRNFAKLSSAYGSRVTSVDDTPSGNHDQARLLVNRAHCKRQRQLQQAALKVSKRAAPHTSSTPTVHLASTRASSALQDLDRALRLDSSFLKAHIRRAQLLLEMGDKQVRFYEMPETWASALLQP